MIHANRNKHHFIDNKLTFCGLNVNQDISTSQLKIPHLQQRYIVNFSTVSGSNDVSHKLANNWNSGMNVD